MDISKALFSGVTEYLTPKIFSSSQNLTSEKIYGFVAFMELGLHPMREENTKYKKEYSIENKHIFKFTPMIPSEYVFGSQWLVRTCLGAHHTDLLIMDDELITLMRRYLWDNVYTAEMASFLVNIVKPGLISIKNVYKNEISFEKHIDLWIKIIDFAIFSCDKKNPNGKNLSSSCVKKPCRVKHVATMESFYEEIESERNSTDKISANKDIRAFYKNCLNLIRATDNFLGEKIKYLLTEEKLRRINNIYSQSVEYYTESEDPEVIKQANESFNQFIIKPAEGQIQILHKDFIDLHHTFFCEYDVEGPIEIASPPPPSPAVTIERPGGVKRVTPQTTPNNSMSEKKE